MNKDSGDRLTFRASSRLVNQLEDIKDLKSLDYSSDAVREAIEFYHDYLIGAEGMGTLVLHLPHGILNSADSLKGWAGNSIQEVLRQAMNIGMSFMLEDMVQQNKNAEIIKRAKKRTSERVSLITVNE